MTEKMWRHLFVQELMKIIMRETGLGQSKAFELAFEDAYEYWAEMRNLDDPESAACVAFRKMKS